MSVTSQPSSNGHSVVSPRRCCCTDAPRNPSDPRVCTLRRILTWTVTSHLQDTHSVVTRFTPSLDNPESGPRSYFTFAIKRNSFVLTNTGDVESPANDRERRVQRGQGPQEGNIAEGRVLGPKLLATPHSSDGILVRSHLTSLIVYVLTGVMEMPPTTFKGLL